MPVFQKLWKSRNRNEARDGSFFKEFCHLYDVLVHENVEESSSVSHEYENVSLDDYEDILCKFLSLIHEHVPEAAGEIESDISASKENGDGYVYDLYTVGNEMSTVVEDLQDQYHLVQVEVEDDFYDGPDKTEYDSPDSNDEDNPRIDQKMKGRVVAHLKRLTMSRIYLKKKPMTRMTPRKTIRDGLGKW